MALIILNFIVNGLEFFIYLNFGTQITLEMIPIALESNTNETQEFFEFYFNERLFFLLIYWIIGVLMFFEKKKYVFITSFLLSIIIIFVGVNFFNIAGTDNIRKSHILKNLWTHYRTYRKTVDETRKLISSYDERMKNVVVYDSVKEGTYVLIIGESFSRNHSSLYGYPRETSPNMVKRYEKGELFKFNDVVSPHNYTRDTLLKIVTEYAYDSDEKFGEAVNIIDIFKKAGYETFWLSNQESFDDEGAGLTSIIKRADVYEFTKKQMYQSKDKSGLDDSSLFPLIDKALAENNKKKFLVIHLYGSHPSYEKRYPEDFKYFDDDAEEDYFFNLQKKNKKRVNEYHNSLRFNDYIFDEIIKKVEKNSTNSFIIYLSDHGNIVYDDNIDFKGHISAKLSIKSVEIPMMIWTSEYYRKSNKDKIERIKSAENKPFSSEDLIYPLIDMANLKYDGYKPEKNLLEEEFVEKDRRVDLDGTIYKKK